MNRVCHTNFQQYVNQLKDPIDRDERETDGKFNGGLSIFTSIGSALLAIYGLVNIKQDPKKGLALIATGAGGLLGSHELSVIAGNTRRITDLANYQPELQFMQSPEIFSETLLEDTWFVNLFHNYYVNWLNAPYDSRFD